MKKASYLILTMFAVSFIVPSIAFASWYNPFSWNWNIVSWFHNSVKTEVMQVSTSTETQNVENLVIDGIDQNVLSASSGSFMVSGTAKKVFSGLTFLVLINDANENKIFSASGVVPNSDGKWSVNIKNIPNGKYTITAYGEEYGNESVFARSLLSVGNVVNSTTVGTTFSATGDLMKNNPGLEKDVWYLVYEQAGKPMLNYKLDITNLLTGLNINNLSNGERVSVTGILVGDIIRVGSIKENATGIIKKVYQKNGKYYLDIDYVDVNKDWVPGGDHGKPYTNVNPTIRTFEISNNAIINSLYYATSTDGFDQTGGVGTTSIEQFKNLLGGIDFYNYTKQQVVHEDYPENTFFIEITNGVITKITEWFFS